jgi:hypothetical protein
VTTRVIAGIQGMQGKKKKQNHGILPQRHGGSEGEKKITLLIVFLYPLHPLHPC